MHWIRDFTRRHGERPDRTVDNDAPHGMRLELVDLFFALADQGGGQVQPRLIYEVTGLMLGAGVTANPFGGERGRVARDIGQAPWQRVYDWISRFWPEFERAGLGPAFCDGVNAVLSAHGIVWELDTNGQIRRFLAEPVRQHVSEAIRELGAERLAPARALFDAATEAFNARPRRNRDVCTNAYDALESVAKIVCEMPAATLGGVLDEVRRRDALNDHVIRLLRDVEILRHNTFGHGMAEDFRLTEREVDFVYATCAAGILLFV